MKNTPLFAVLLVITILLLKTGMGVICCNKKLSVA